MRSYLFYFYSLVNPMKDLWFKIMDNNMLSYTILSLVNPTFSLNIKLI